MFVPEMLILKAAMQNRHILLNLIFIVSENDLGLKGP